ncbi:MAG: pilus assembly protein [Chloroflexi bacterium]|nr:pilus assembly protein [Chloroflexota bacterium]MBF6606780.1 pilus assembly protein [Chloroflexota bacterium]
MRSTPRISPRRRVGRSGQALVEFALVVPLLFFMMVIIIDFGRALYIQTALQNGAREGARFGIVHPTWVTAADRANPDNIVYRASTEPAATVSAVNATVTCTTPGGVTSTATSPVSLSPAYVSCAVSGGRIDVKITYDFTPLTPLISNVVGTSLTLSGHTRMTIE